MEEAEKRRVLTVRPAGRYRRAAMEDYKRLFHLWVNGSNVYATGKSLGIGLSDLLYDFFNILSFRGQY
jgi:hypothetical protein